MTARNAFDIHLRVLNQSNIRRFLDRAAFAALTAMIVSGIITYAATPFPAMDSGELVLSSQAVLGLSFGQWFRLHHAASVIFLFTLLPNLWMERRALPALVGKQTAEGSRKRAALGALAAIGIVAYAVLRPSVTGPRMKVDTSEAEAGRVSAEEKVAAMKFGDMSRRMAVPESVLRSRLKVPADVSGETPFGDVMKKAGFTWDDFQAAVFEYHQSQPPTR